MAWETGRGVREPDRKKVVEKKTWWKIETYQIEGKYAQRNKNCSTNKSWAKKYQNKTRTNKTKSRAIKHIPFIIPISRSSLLTNLKRQHKTTQTKSFIANWIGRRSTSFCQKIACFALQTAIQHTYTHTHGDLEIGFLNIQSQVWARKQIAFSWKMYVIHRTILEISYYNGNISNFHLDVIYNPIDNNRRVFLHFK